MKNSAVKQVLGLFFFVFLFFWRPLWAGAAPQAPRPPASAGAPELYEPAFKAMRHELQRSLQELRLEDHEPPYFILYRLSFVRQYSLWCGYGDIGTESETISQIPFVEVRVGSYSLDNTWEGFATGQHFQSGSLGIKEDVLRQLFWHLTDTAYKNALRQYLDKKARSAIELEEDEGLPDFSRQQPQQFLKPKEEPPSLDKDLLRSFCRSASREFNKYPDVDFSFVTLSFNADHRLLINSEGTQGFVEANPTAYGLYIHGQARAADGLAVDSFVSRRFRYLKNLPTKQELEALVLQVADEVAALKRAPLGLPELGPALLDSESTGVFFHEALGHRLEGLRQREKSEQQTFKGKVGTRIIPDFLNVISDPTMSFWGDVALSGHYAHDSEGVPAERLILVQQGLLKNYLMSRRPVKGFLVSNGHGRSDAFRLAEGRMSVLIMETASGLTKTELKDRFLQEIRQQGKKHGFRLVSMRSGEAQTRRGFSQSFVSRPRLIYQVDAQGRETLVRGLEYVGTPLVAIEKITAAGKDLEAHNAQCGSNSGWVPVSEIAPSVILSELELQREPEDRFRPPILEGPIF